MKLTRVLAYVAFVACATLMLSSTSFAQSQTGWYPYARSATIGDTILVGDYYFCPIIYGFCPCMDNSTLSDTVHFFWRDSVGHDFQNGDGLAAYKLYYHPTSTDTADLTFTINIECYGPRTCAESNHAVVFDTFFGIPKSARVVEPESLAFIVQAENFSNHLLLRLGIPTSIRANLFDGTGRLVRSIERACPAGPSEISLDATSLPAGCYWYVLRGRTIGAQDWMRSGKVMKLEP